MCRELKQSVGSWAIYFSTEDCAPSTYRDLVEEEEGDPRNHQPSLLPPCSHWSFPERPWRRGCARKWLLHLHHSYSPLCSPCCPGVWRSVDWPLCLFCTGIWCSSQEGDFRWGTPPQFRAGRQQGEVDLELKIPFHMLTSKGWVCLFGRLGGQWLKQRI